MQAVPFVNLAAVGFFWRISAWKPQEETSKEKK